MKQIKIGTATLIHGDCEEFMRDMPDKCFDLAVVDPPYGIKRLSVEENRTEGSKYRKSMSKMVDSAKAWNSIKPGNYYFDNLFRVSREQIVWGANNFTLPESEYFCVWDKQQTVSNFASAEYAWVSMNKWKKPAKVFTYQIHAANAVEAKIHPTQKPIKLYEWIYANYARTGDRILDTHGGSMSSVIAALNMGFEITCIEKDEDYFNAAVERVIKSQQQQKLF